MAPLPPPPLDPPLPLRERWKHHPAKLLIWSSAVAKCYSSRPAIIDICPGKANSHNSKRHFTCQHIQALEDLEDYTHTRDYAGMIGNSRQKWAGHSMLPRYFGVPPETMETVLLTALLW